MQFSHLARYFQKLESQDSRLAMTVTLAELFGKVTSGEIDKVCYFALGELVPKYKGIEFNMAEKMAIKALAAAAGQTVDMVAGKVKEVGDIGDAAIQVISYKLKAKSTVELVITEVYQRLLEIAEEEGTGSVDRKITRLAKLLKELDILSAKYVLRMVVGKLRLGFSSMTILDALSWFKTGDKSLREPLEKAFNTQADIGQIAKIFKKDGLKEIKKIQPVPGIPVRAAKAERLKDAADILDKLKGQCLLEPKIDGFRLMLHLDKKQKEENESKNLTLFGGDSVKKYLVRLFSRNLDNMTDMFPDVVAAAQRLSAESAILDGEAIAVDPKTGKFLPFQETVQRKRKHNVAKKAKEIPLKVFIFDLLYLNGDNLMRKPFRERRAQLERLLKNTDTRTLMLTEQMKVSRPEQFDQFFAKVHQAGLEGLMAKKANTPYRAGIRDHNWVKYKVAMQSELADTIDCVVMGYYKGKGKRQQFGIGAFLVGVVDKNKILTVSKIGTGLTDEQWQEIFKRCQKLKTEKKPAEYRMDKNLNPDMWCRPQLVVEIEADTITKSPLHSAGLALRFPRLKHFRDDKLIEEATTIIELKKMYQG